MGVDAGAIKEIEALVKKGTDTKDIDGRTYMPEGFKMVEEPLAAPLKVSTLQAMVDYINNKVDDVIAKNLLIHVLGPDQVELCGHLFRATRQREILLYANLPHTPFVFGKWTGQEEFVIALLSMFEQNAELKELLKVAGSITDEAVKTEEDDGVTQRAVARVGIARVENVTVKGRYTLKPHRTFMEIEQPASDFIFRIRSGSAHGPVGLALFEADSGAWKLEAISKVATWLKGAIEENITIMS